MSEGLMFMSEESKPDSDGEASKELAISQALAPLTAQDNPEPSLSDQLAISDADAAIRNEIFARSGQKIPPNDPVIQLFVFQQKLADEQAKILRQTAEALKTEMLEKYQEEMTIATNINLENQRLVNDAFDTRLKELNDTLKYLEDHKNLIVTDVWGKMDNRVATHFTEVINKNFQKITAAANTKVNNERILTQGLMKGGIIGALGAVVVCAILFTIFLMLKK